MIKGNDHREKGLTFYVATFAYIIKTKVVGGGFVK
jgi:hypothetical protein